MTDSTTKAELSTSSTLEVKQALMRARKAREIAPLEEAVRMPLRTGQCRCGRLNFPTHCPACGSLNIYSREKGSEFFKDSDGSLFKAPGQKCRRCGLKFTWITPCEAAALDAKSKTSQAMRLESDALAELKARFERGELPLAEYLRQVNPNAEREFNKGKK